MDGGGDDRERATTTTCTAYERLALGGAANLTDASPRQAPTPAQQLVVDRLPELFAEAGRRSQVEQEAAYVDAFLGLAGQERVVPHDRHLLSYSASCAMTMVASHCRALGLRVGLIEPVFDSIPSILRREGVTVVPLREARLRHDPVAAVAAAEVDVVWLVSPNNPTGWELGEAELQALADACAATGRLLVLDLCFRFFSASMARWQQYRLLRDSGVSFVTVEDTGKTWPLRQMKVGMLVCSDDLAATFHRHHDDLLQHVSPVHLRLLEELIADTTARGRDSIRQVAARNRALLRFVLTGVPVDLVTAADAPVPVEWLRLRAGLTGEQLWARLGRDGVAVLPGRNFFWSDPARGERYVRLPLSRDVATIAAAARPLRAALLQLSAPPRHHSRRGPTVPGVAAPAVPPMRDPRSPRWFGPGSDTRRAAWSSWQPPAEQGVPA